MNKIREVLLEQPLEVQFRMQNLALIVKDPQTDPIERLVAAVELSDLGAPLMMESIRREFTPTEPKFEYRFVRGAKVKVQVK